MDSDSNPTATLTFNPDQTINLSSKTNNSGAENKPNPPANINLAQKINLKNHISSQSVKKRAKRHLNGQINSKVKLQQKQTSERNSASNLPMFNDIASNLPLFNETQSFRGPPAMTASNVTKISQPFQSSRPNFGKNMKMEHELYQPVKVNPMEKIYLGPKTQNSVSHEPIVENPKKYKIRVLNSDFTSMRYECFCSRQYLSYCAAYHHLKKDHYDFLKQNRRFSFTNVLDTTHPVYGFRIKKIMKERLKCPNGQNKDQIETLSRQTKEKIKIQSNEIQKLLQELKGIDDQRDQQLQMLRLFERKLLKATQLMEQYQKMIFNFQNIFNVLNIKQITQKISNDPTVLEQQSNQHDEDYFPQ